MPDAEESRRRVEIEKLREMLRTEREANQALPPAARLTPEDFELLDRIEKTIAGKRKNSIQMMRVETIRALLRISRS